MFARPFEFCLATNGKGVVPAGPDWIHEIKADGYRIRTEKDGDRVRLFSRGGQDFTKRYPLVVEAARKHRRKRFVVDGEIVVLNQQGMSDFNALHSRKHDREAQLYAFDLLALDDDDLRRLPLSERKEALADLLKRPPSGMFMATFERGAIGPDLFRHACLMGLEGLVSKHLARPYIAGRTDAWRKNKNRQHPSTERVFDR
ncbi:bifunctional non-homologous end joining protein LigD [Bradyrhizobium sp. USDA 4341]